MIINVICLVLWLALMVADIIALAIKKETEAPLFRLILAELVVILAYLEIILRPVQ